MHLNGTILDVYDDPSATLLRQKLGSSPIPSHLDCTLLGAEELQALPDRLFALVATNGDTEVRKFAMHDAEHLGLSIIYFLDTHSILPEASQKVAAANLVFSCGEYGITPPDELMKLAVGPMGVLEAGLGALDVGMRGKELAQKPKGMAAFHAAQAGQTSDMQAQQKMADLNGTEMMPMAGPLSTLPLSKNTAGGSAAVKKAGWVHAGDLTAHKQTLQAPGSTKFACADRYPIDSYENVKTAGEYFERNWREFSLDDRREFAVNVEARMAELGMGVPPSVMKYAGFEYGPHIDSELIIRTRNYEGFPSSGAYTLLLEKRASAPPHVMLELLHEVDRLAGAEAHYGTQLGFRDPYQAVYGKVAAAPAAEAPSWKWAGENLCTASGKQVSGETIKRAFGEDAYSAFKSNPKAAYETKLSSAQRAAFANLK